MVAAIGLLLAGASVPGKSELVVDGLPQSAAVVAHRAALSAQALDTELTAKGYSAEDSDGVRYLFSEDVWQGRAMAALIASYGPFEQSLGAGGRLDPGKDTAVSQFVNERLADMGYQLAPGANVYAGVRRTCTFQLGNRTVTLTGGSGTNANAAATQLQPLDDLHRKRYAHRHSLLFPPYYGAEAFSAYGDLATNRSAAKDAYLKATELLGAHWRDFRNRSKAKLQQLIDKICGYRISDYFGVAGSNLPDGLKRMMQAGVCDPQSAGFGSRADEQAWMNQATLIGSSANVELDLPPPPRTLHSGALVWTFRSHASRALAGSTIGRTMRRLICWRIALRFRSSPRLCPGASR